MSYSFLILHTKIITMANILSLQFDQILKTSRTSQGGGCPRHLFSRIEYHLEATKYKSSPMGGTLATCQSILCTEDVMYNDVKRRNEPVVERLPLPRLVVGEGPHWSISNQSLYLVDTGAAVIYRYSPATNRYYSAKIDVPSIGFIIPISGADNLFLIGAGLTLYSVTWNGFSSQIESIYPLHKLEDEPETNRINDGKCDPVGRLWFGTMKIDDILNGRVAAAYSYNRESGCIKHLTDIGISNGLSWDLGKRVMYYIDTVNQTVDVMDYSRAGTIANRRVAFDLKANGLPCFPDGMTIDSDGNLWVACYAGSRVIKVDPVTGELLDQVSIPVKNVTSVAWGGPDLSELYVTTNNVDNDDSDVNGGYTFRIKGLSAHGLPMSDFRL